MVWLLHLLFISYEAGSSFFSFRTGRGGENMPCREKFAASKKMVDSWQALYYKPLPVPQA
jgi:hypothetical protein